MLSGKERGRDGVWSAVVAFCFFFFQAEDGIRDGESFACTVYVGDGVWDARACRSVGIPFIGIGTGSRATRLSAEGAVCVFADFSDTELFLSSVYEITNAA